MGSKLTDQEVTITPDQDKYLDELGRKIASTFVKDQLHAGSRRLAWFDGICEARQRFPNTTVTMLTEKISKYLPAGVDANGKPAPYQHRPVVTGEIGRLWLLAGATEEARAQGYDVREALKTQNSAKVRNILGKPLPNQTQPLLPMRGRGGNRQKTEDPTKPQERVIKVGSLLDGVNSIADFLEGIEGRLGTAFRIPLMRIHAACETLLGRLVEPSTPAADALAAISQQEATKAESKGKVRAA